MGETEYKANLRRLARRLGLDLLQRNADMLKRYMQKQRSAYYVTAYSYFGGSNSDRIIGRCYKNQSPEILYWAKHWIYLSSFGYPLMGWQT